MGHRFTMTLHMQVSGHINKASPQTYEASRYGNNVIMGKLGVIVGLKKIFLDLR